MFLVALGHKKQQGKDTVADFLSQHHGFIKVSFAGVLKDFCADLFGVPRVAFDRDDIKDRVYYWDSPNPDEAAKKVKFWYERISIDVMASPRQLCQAVGQSARKVFGADFWVQQLIKKIEGIQRDHAEQIPDAPLKIVVSDLRMHNELKAIQKLGGYVCKVIRVMDDPSTEPTDKHISEIDLDDYHGWDGYIVANNGDIAHLHETTTIIMDRLEAQHGERSCTQ